MTATTPGAADLPNFVYHLRHTPAEEVAQAINDFLVNQGGPSSPAPSGPGRPPSTAAALSSGPVVAEKTTNSLLVRGTPEELQKIYELITQLDRSPPQVVIQALLVEVELGNVDEFGMELGVQDSVLFQRSVIDNILTISETVTSPNGVQTSNQRIISQTAQPGFNFNNQPLGNNVAIKPSRVGSQGLSSFGVGRVNGDLGYGGLVLSAGSESINVLIRALAEHHHVDILSRPQIRTLDNHEAVIQIGQQVPVVDGVAISAVGSANPVIRQDQSGIILKVTPRISPDGLVLIEVNAEKSAFQLSPGSGVPIFTDATNGNVIEAPVKDITTAQTSVSVQTGQTIVLGGMITRDTATVSRKVPFLGDIPIAGHLFRYDYERCRRKELLIFLTPQVVYGAATSEAIKEQEVARVSMLWGEAEQIHGPILATPPFVDGTAQGLIHADGAFLPSPSSDFVQPASAETTAPQLYSNDPNVGVGAYRPAFSSKHNWQPFSGYSAPHSPAGEGVPPQFDSPVRNHAGPEASGHMTTPIQNGFEYSPSTSSGNFAPTIDLQYSETTLPSPSSYPTHPSGRYHRPRVIRPRTFDGASKPGNAPSPEVPQTTETASRRWWKLY
ncbi:MAG: hypothetical protein KDA80_15065 [Planctomycetaceae bacterium]|nr:hypothetical protein [Planctomycetaceae bacterium]